MERFYFDVENGSTDRDAEGTELADLDKAKCEAVTILAQVMHGRPQEFWSTEALSVTCSNSDRLTLFSVGLAVNWAPSLAKPPNC